jgi:S1-C subfamily serine protease
MDHQDDMQAGAPRPEAGAPRPEAGGTGPSGEMAAAAPAGQAPAGPPPRSRYRRALALTAIGGLLAGALGGGLWAGVVTHQSGNARPAAIQVPGQSSDSGAPKSVSTVVAEVSPAVVDINVTLASPAGDGQAGAAGTGMIITKSGEVLTNNHVVKDATSVRVTLPSDGRSYPAKVLGVDPGKDVALVQIEDAGSNLPTVPLGNSGSAAVGASVVAIGNALGRGGTPAVVTGRITGLDETQSASDQGVTSSTETLHHLIRSNAQIVPGDSGGPLANSSGQVIGMNTMASTSPDGTTAGMSIPIDQAIAIANQIAAGSRSDGVLPGESAYLGIFEQEGAGNGITGVYVSDLASGGPAERAGIQGGDTITAVNGHTTDSISALEKVISALRPGQQVPVSYVDFSGAEHTTQVVLAGLPK